MPRIRFFPDDVDGPADHPQVKLLAARVRRDHQAGWFNDYAHYGAMAAAIVGYIFNMGSNYDTALQVAGYFIGLAIANEKLFEVEIKAAEEEGLPFAEEAVNAVFERHFELVGLRQFLPF